MRFILSIMVMLFTAAPALTDDTITAKQETQYLLDQLTHITGVPAFSVAIWQNGRSLHKVAVGEVNMDPSTKAQTNNLFRIASVSKVVSATIIARLVQDGLLDPDAPIGQYLQNLDSQYRNITMRQLMAHTSGMPHYQAVDEHIGTKQYYSAIDALETLSGRPLLSTPGDTYSYSSHGYTLAGAVIEAITGKTLSQSLPTNIQALTGKPSPRIENVTKRMPQRSNLFERDGKEMKNIKFDNKSYSVMGAGMTAAADDLAAFGDAVLHSNWLSSETREMLFTPTKTADGSEAGNGTFKVGFGWRIGKDDSGRTIYHHAGITPGARSVLVLYPDTGLSIAFLSNASWTSQIERTAFALADLFMTTNQSEKTLGNHQFSGSFGDSPISGQLNCSNNLCELSDQDGALSSWLNRFNATSNTSSNWPVNYTKNADGQRITIVTKVGFIVLTAEPNSNHFKATVGRSRLLEITLKADHDA